MGENARRVRAQEAALAAGGTPANAPRPGQQGYGGSAQQRHDLEQQRKEGYGTAEKPFGANVAGSTNIRGGATDIRGGSTPTSMPTFSMQSAPPPQVSAPQIQGPAVMPGTTAPQLVTKASAPDPNTTRFLGQLDTRLQQQQAGENASVTASAERATNLARRDIGDAAAAQKKMKEEELAARGLSGGAGAGAGQLRAIDEAARTRGARASADIGLAREGEQDRLNLARTGMTNALYGQMGSASQVPFQQQMQGNQQALDTWRANDASQMGRAGMNLQAQTTNAQLQMEQQRMQQQLAQQQQQQQQAMWMALMGQR